MRIDEANFHTPWSLSPEMPTDLRLLAAVCYAADVGAASAPYRSVNSAITSLLEDSPFCRVHIVHRMRQRGPSRQQSSVRFGVVLRVQEG
jgi:hypothetical protein